MGRNQNVKVAYPHTRTYLPWRNPYLADKKKIPHFLLESYEYWNLLNLNIFFIANKYDISELTLLPPGNEPETFRLPGEHFASKPLGKSNVKMTNHRWFWTNKTETASSTITLSGDYATYIPSPSLRLALSNKRK